jgi:hypothetical protein
MFESRCYKNYAHLFGWSARRPKNWIICERWYLTILKSTFHIIFSLCGHKATDVSTGDSVFESRHGKKFFLSAQRRADVGVYPRPSGSWCPLLRPSRCWCPHPRPSRYCCPPNLLSNNIRMESFLIGEAGRTMDSTFNYFLCRSLNTWKFTATSPHHIMEY